MFLCALAVRRWRRRSQRMSPYSVMMRGGQGGHDQMCLIFNQEADAQVLPVSYCPTDSVAGGLAFGPPPSAKGLLTPVASSGAQLFHPDVSQQ